MEREHWRVCCTSERRGRRSARDRLDQAAGHVRPRSPRSHIQLEDGRVGAHTRLRRRGPQLRERAQALVGPATGGRLSGQAGARLGPNEWRVSGSPAGTQRSRHVSRYRRLRKYAGFD